MGHIRVLDDAAINRIAAGEVVERPASVVKELLENSLDAGATSITIELEGGGKRLVRVVDDGCGMDRDDALLALERHATSKLAAASDLQAIRTLGFRGEALPSIAAVSRFTLRTAAADGAGTEVEVQGGKIAGVREVGMPRGTTVEVARLFFNVPARRKFLRSEATELAHVMRSVGRYALVRPAIRLRLRHEARVMLEAPAVAAPLQRIRQVHGAELADRLVPFALERGGFRATGFASRPVDATSRRDALHLFVNGRLVQDRVLSHGIQEGFGNTMARGLHPVVFLFLEVDPAEVDVNVHPQKSEVRFRRSGEAHDVARDAVASVLGQAAVVPSITELRPAGEVARSLPSVSEAALRYLEARREAPEVREPRAPGLYRATTGEAARPGGPAALVALAQLRSSYILAEDERGLVLVDQHAAHERVLFERYLAAAEADTVDTQRLLFPRTVELGPRERVLLEEEAPEFRRLGFLVEPFGGGTFRLDGVPAILGDLDPERVLAELLGEAGRTRSAAAAVPELRRKLVTSAACQAAIKVNHPLSLAAMQALLDDLVAAESPSTCPHGRPALFRMSLEEIERGFRRR